MNLEIIKKIKCLHQLVLLNSMT